jgi:hypothetical protein
MSDQMSYVDVIKYTFTGLLRMFFFISLSLLSTLLFPNSLYFVFILLSNVILVLYYLVSSLCLSVLTILIFLIVYLGAIIILIGYICAVCPNLNLSSSVILSPLISLSLLSTLLLSYLTFPSLPLSSVSTVTEFFYSSSGLFVFAVLILILFLTLLIVTSQYSTPTGPFRSVV